MSMDTVPAKKAETVTPSDSTNLTYPTRALYIGGAGDVVAIIDGTAHTFVGCPAGLILPIVCTRVNSTSTTATSIIALR